jgi:glycosyltransferase involved in cell wall biosynthesis
VLIGDGGQKTALVERCTTEKISNVSFYDPMPKTELCVLLANADVGLMILANVPAFYYGTSPNKFFDYIALGLPVINNYPGWLAEMIGSEKLGVVVPPDKPNKLAEALICLADNPSSRKEMGLRARKYAKAKFDRYALSNRFVDELERVAGQ